MAPDTVLLPVFTRQTLAVINFICLSQSPPSVPRLPAAPLPSLQKPSIWTLGFRRQWKLLRPAAKNYQVKTLNEDEELENVSSWKNVDYKSRGPGGFSTIYPHILSCLSRPTPLHVPPGAPEKQLALSAAKRIYQSKWYCKPYGRHTLCEDLKDIRRMAQAGNPGVPGNSHCLECVRMCTCGHLHVAQCVSAWQDKRRSTMHPRHQRRRILVWIYITAHIFIITLWWSLSAVCITATIFTLQDRPGSEGVWNLLFIFSFKFHHLLNFPGALDGWGSSLQASHGKRK